MVYVGHRRDYKTVRDSMLYCTVQYEYSTVVVADAGGWAGSTNGLNMAVWKL